MSSGRMCVMITVVGDDDVGKTCMLISYTTKEFPQDDVPTVFRKNEVNIVVDGEEFVMALWETSPKEDYEKLYFKAFLNTDCALVCFSVANRASYDNVRFEWGPEIRHHCRNSPIVLVATKIDLRDDPTQVTITTAEGEKLRDEIEAARYVECSAKTGQDIYGPEYSVIFLHAGTEFTLIGGDLKVFQNKFQIPFNYCP